MLGQNRKTAQSNRMSSAACPGGSRDGREAPAALTSRKEKRCRAEAMYRAGWKLVNIAAEIGVPPGTVRRWKCVFRWGEEAERAKGESADVYNSPFEAALSDALDSLEGLALTDKQRQFVILYARTFNATRSYQKTYGCSYASALVRGPVLAGKAVVRDAVRLVRKALLSRILLEPGDIVQKIIECHPLIKNDITRRT